MCCFSNRHTSLYMYMPTYIPIYFNLMNESVWRKKKLVKFPLYSHKNKNFIQLFFYAPKPEDN